MSVETNLQLIQKSIIETANQSDRDPDDIKLIAVSKTRAVEEVQRVIDAGLTVFGENTIQDAMTKIPVLNSDSNEWHFIGHLQSKKAKNIPGNFQWIHTIDSIKLAERLSAAMCNSGETEPLNCLIQINTSGESSKFGIPLQESELFFKTLFEMNLPLLSWRGLMTIGVNNDEQRTRTAFSLLRKSMKNCQQKFSLKSFDQLSMGMSGDYQIAIEEGATMIRIGTSIFGHRNRSKN